MPRIARIVGVGYPHHIVQRGNNQQAIFFDDEDRGFYLKLLKKNSKKYSCQIHVYCLMDNHVHLLAVPEYEYSFAKMMQQLSLRFTQYCNKKYKRTGRLWECRFYSSLIDKDNYFLSVCRYIERNPVRAKIITNPMRYNWSSAKINTGQRKSDWVDPIYNNYINNIEDYVGFLSMPDEKSEMEIIKRSTNSGKPMGDIKFITKIINELEINLNLTPKGRPKRNKKIVCVPI